MGPSHVSLLSSSVLMVVRKHRNAAERNGRPSEARGLLEGVLRGGLEAYRKLRGPTPAD